MVMLRINLCRTFLLAGLFLCVGQFVTAGTFELETRSEATLMKRKVRAAQFLHRATFGPTIEDIDALAARMQQIGVRRACEEWIDQQFEMP